MTSEHSPLPPHQGHGSGDPLQDFRIVVRGSLSPDELVALYARTNGIFSGIDGLSVAVELVNDDAADQDASQHEKRTAWLNTELADNSDVTGLSARTEYLLRREGISTYREIVLYGSEALTDMRNFGPKAMREVSQAISNNEFGLMIPIKPTLADATKLCDSVHQLPDYFAFGGDRFKGQGTTVGALAEMDVEDLIPRTHLVYDAPSNQFVTAPLTVQKAQEFRDDLTQKRAQAQACAQEFARLKEFQA